VPLLTVEHLTTHFHTRDGVVRAVEGVSFMIEPGETLGIVGESGSGKSVTMLSLMGLVPSPPGRIESGSARFDGIDLLRCAPKDLRRVRGKRVSMIFQDPMTALNPYMTIGAQVMEPLVLHEGTSKREARDRAVAALEEVGIQDAPARMTAYPHEFSGGMRQRVMIAMALITKPDLLIADEPTTALDVTVQAQILDLIKRLQEQRGMAVVLITHDLGVIAGTCARVLVMYAGRIMESASAEALFEHPRHPYTRALMASLPSTHVKGDTLKTIPGMPPDLVEPIIGCPFAPRCDHSEDLCREAPCELGEVASNHASACVRVRQGELP
jgi:oligopeptide transport system ATP-binding protein